MTTHLIKYLTFCIIHMWGVTGKLFYYVGTESSFNPLYVQDYKMITTANNISADMYLNLLKPFPKVTRSYLSIDVAKSKSNRFRNMFKLDSNMCNVMRSKSLDLLTMTVQRFLARGNFPKYCPVEKGNYSWHDIRTEGFYMPTVANKYRINFCLYIPKASTKEIITNATSILDVK